MSRAGAARPATAATSGWPRSSAASGRGAAGARIDITSSWLVTRCSTRTASTGRRARRSCATRSRSSRRSTRRTWRRAAANRSAVPASRASSVVDQEDPLLAEAVAICPTGAIIRRAGRARCRGRPLHPLRRLHRRGASRDQARAGAARHRLPPRSAAIERGEAADPRRPPYRVGRSGSTSFDRSCAGRAGLAGLRSLKRRLT